MRPPSGGPHRSPPAETGDIPRHSLITPWRLRGYMCMGSTDLHAPSLHMIGRGIPAPTPPNTKWDVGALPPIPSVHRRVTVRSRNGRLAHVHQWAVHDLPRRIKCDRDGWSAPINAFGRRRSRLLKPPRGVQAKASGGGGGGSAPRVRGVQRGTPNPPGDGRPLFGQTPALLRGALGPPGA